MIKLINPRLFSANIKAVKGTTKIQLTDVTGERICTIVTDSQNGERIDNKNVSIRVKPAELSSSGKTEVLLRSSESNNYDSEIIVAAIPFEGVLLPTAMQNYRFRYAKVVEVESSHVQNLPNIEVTWVDCLSQFKGEKILYCILEPNMIALRDIEHRNHADKIQINIPFAKYDFDNDRVLSNTNFRICVDLSEETPCTYAPRVMPAKDIEKIKNEIIKFYNAEKDVPYNIYDATRRKKFTPRNKKTQQGTEEKAVRTAKQEESRYTKPAAAPKKKMVEKKQPAKTYNSFKELANSLTNSDDYIENGGQKNKYAGLNKRNKSKKKK